MRTVGIIGGLGPETTAHFYMEIIKLCNDRNLPGRPPILLWNVPLLHELERDLIRNAEEEERYIPLLIEAARTLEKGGADFLVMPCNSLHIFIEQIRGSVSIPVISIIEVAAQYLGEHQVKAAGILATHTTVRSGMFQDAFRAQGIAPVLPIVDDQKLLANIILQIIEGKSGEEDRQGLGAIMLGMNVQTILLACTDLQLLLREQEGLQIIDTMQLLAKATIREIIGDEI